MNCFVKILIIVIILFLSLIKCGNSFEECAISDAVSDEHITHTKQNPSVPQRRQKKNEITLEIGVYFDVYLKRKFNNNEREVEKYIKVLMSGTQTVFKYPTMRSRVNLIVTQYEMVPNNSVPYVQDLVIYYNTFCDWQKKRMKNRENYDLAILLTSRNLFIGHKGNKNGYAPQARLCQPQHDNCALIKTNYVNSMWTIAHEIGHKLGIPHDEDKCGPNGVMSPVQEKPFHWTECSNNHLETFIATKQFSECLFKRSGQQLNGWHLNSVNFHSYSMEEQCAINFGPKYKPYPLMIKVCLALPCIYDLFQPLNAGAPLEMTVCKNKTLNFEGKCVRSNCIK